MKLDIDKYFDFYLSNLSIDKFRKFVAAICIYEFLLRSIFFHHISGVDGFSPFSEVINYLQTTDQLGWSHYLFFVDAAPLFQHLLHAAGTLLAALVFFRIFLNWSLLLLAFIWMNFCYRYPFLSHGGDTIVFFSLIVLALGSIKVPGGAQLISRKHFCHLIIFQFALIMFFAGLNKLSGPWLQGIAVEQAIRYDSFSAISFVPEFAVVPLKIVSWVTPFFEMALPLFLIIRVTRQLAVYSLLAFSAALMIFFSSGTLGLIISGFAVIFWRLKGKSDSQIDASDVQTPLSAWVATAFAIISLYSSFANLRIFDKSDSLWAQPIKHFEKKYYFAQNWSYMTRPYQDLLKIKVQSTTSSNHHQNYTIKTWVQEWSDNSFVNFALTHRRAIFFKQLFWNQNQALSKIFGALYCRKYQIQNETLEFQLFIGDNRRVKSFEYSCQH